VDPRRPPHVAQVSFFLDPQGRTPAQMLADWPSLVDVAEAARHGGARVTVVQASSSTAARFERNGVDYRFVAAEPGQSSIASGRALRDLLARLDVDLLHVHGLGFVHDVATLAELAPDVGILLQDHAGRPPRFWRRQAWRRMFDGAAAVAFCAREQAAPFVQAGLIGPQIDILELPEAPARFAPGDQAEARRRTGLSGRPCMLWVGHLDSNKDPLTVLEGVSRAARRLPELQLWCCFGQAPLLTRVRPRIARDPWLRDKVHLLGRVPHAEIEHLMRAADLFVLGSHREGSGYALAEALACGLSPVVSDIPSFRAMTGRGAVGWTWTPGDARAACDALLEAASRPHASVAAQVRQHFERELSFEAVARKLNAGYARLLAPHATTPHATTALGTSHEHAA
jgi:glycosyltransferase involved in cell wall biosynthesis